MIDSELKVEAYMTDPPTPFGFGVVVNGRVVATLSHAQVKLAIEQYDAMEKIRNARGAPA